MDLSELLSVYQPFTSPPMEAMNSGDNNSIVSLSQSTVSSTNEMLLQVLFPSEDTIKTCLDSDQHKNNDAKTNCDKSINSLNLNIDKFYFKTNCRFGSKRPEADYIDLHDIVSESMYSDILDQLVFKLVDQNNLSLAALEFNSYENSETLDYQHYNEYQALQPNLQLTKIDYVNLRANTLLLAKLGYKLTITLNLDNDKVPETWNPNVAQKILSVDYSPLNLLKDCYHAQAPLNQLECFLLAEVVNAFQDKEPIKLPDFSLKVRNNPSPGKFASICNKLGSFRKLCNNDKIVLFSSSYYEVVSMNVILKYNQSTDDWISPEYGIIFGRRDLFIWNRCLHDKIVPVIETFPNKWRKDEVVEALISLIIIFNPDQVGLIFADAIRHQQYVYIYLLKRYLESVCISPSEASDNLYRLMVGVEKFRELGKVVCESTNLFETGFHRSLRNLIIDVVNNGHDKF